MKTRNILLIAAVAAFMSSAQVVAQNTNTAARQDRADVNELLDKRCHRMESQLKLDDATAAKFAPLYKEYLKEMKACHPAPCKKEKKGQCCDADKKARMEKGFDCREKMVKTQKKYYKEFEKFLNAEQLETLFSRRHAGNKCKAGKNSAQCSHNGHKNHGECNQAKRHCK